MEESERREGGMGEDPIERKRKKRGFDETQEKKRDTYSSNHSMLILIDKSSSISLKKFERELRIVIFRAMEGSRGAKERQK